MTAALQPESSSPSRRALLAGAVGGIGAWAAGAIGRARPARAANGDPVTLGSLNVATANTRISNTGTNGGFEASTLGAGTGVRGTSASGYGVCRIRFQRATVPPAIAISSPFCRPSSRSPRCSISR